VKIPLRYRKSSALKLRREGISRKRSDRQKNGGKAQEYPRLKLKRITDIVRGKSRLAHPPENGDPSARREG